MSARRAASLAVTPPRADRIQVVADAFAAMRSRPSWATSASCVSHARYATRRLDREVVKAERGCRTEGEADGAGKKLKVGNVADPVVLHAPRTKGAAPPPKGGLRSNCVAGCATTVTVVLDNETTVVPYTNRNCLVLARHIERLAYTNLNLLVAQVQAQALARRSPRAAEEVQER